MLCEQDQLQNLCEPLQNGSVGHLCPKLLRFPGGQQYSMKQSVRGHTALSRSHVPEVSPGYKLHSVYTGVLNSPIGIHTLGGYYTQKKRTSETLPDIVNVNVTTQTSASR
jgi:hypothetical protein